MCREASRIVVLGLGGSGGSGAGICAGIGAGMGAGLGGAGSSDLCASLLAILFHYRYFPLSGRVVWKAFESTSPFRRELRRPASLELPTSGKVSVVSGIVSVVSAVVPLKLPKVVSLP